MNIVAQYSPLTYSLMVVVMAYIEMFLLKQMIIYKYIQLLLSQPYFKAEVIEEIVVSDEEMQEVMKKLYPPNFQTVQSIKETNPIYEKLQDQDHDKKGLEESMKELDQLIGLESVKQYIRDLKTFIEVQQIRKTMGNNQSYQTLHMIFTGNPGTGKTTVARIIAQILKELKVVSKGHLVEVTREDLVEGYIGQTAKKTRNVIEKAKGGILFIDEAYTLSRGGQQDFGKEAIDTLVKAMEDYRHDLVVILAGYTKEMEEFLKTNSGLRSRFPNKIEFPDYTAEELLAIAKEMMKKEQYYINEETEKELLTILERKQIKGKNDEGNGRLVRNLLQQAALNHAKRIKPEHNINKAVLNELKAIDFGYEETTFDLDKELNTIIGNESIKEQLKILQAQVKINKIRKANGLKQLNEQSLHMVFRGNPGTGKTTVARVVARMLKEMGILKKGHLIEVTRKDLVAEYVGQTAIKTADVIHKALGGVLFIDEAYELAQGDANDFGKEAINTLLREMEEYRGEFVVILAGYHHEMDQLLNTNPGLLSRFPHNFVFNDYTAYELLEIFKAICKKEGYILEEEAVSYVFEMIQTANTANGNGRWVRNVFEKAIQRQAYRLANEQNYSIEALQTLKKEDVID